LVNGSAYSQQPVSRVGRQVIYLLWSPTETLRHCIVEILFIWIFKVGVSLAALKLPF
jgi:hypothetical protein